MEHFELFGGKFFTKKQAQQQMLEIASGNEDLAFLLPALLKQADPKRALVWAGDHTVSGDWKLDRHQRWVRDNGIAAVVCLGSLTVEGNLLSLDDGYWPLLFVAGDLRVRNLVKGGLPLFVLGNLHASGYFVTVYNDGLLRVGGDLVAAGYTPRCRDYPEAKGHVIAGSVRARTFDMRPPAEIKRKHHRATFVPEALDEGWLDWASVLEREHEGLPVWKDQPDPILPDVPVEPPPMPEISSVDPTGLGTLSGTWPDWIVRHFDIDLDGQVLTLPAGTHLSGDLELEWSPDWIQRNSIVCIACEGDLTVDGDVLNFNWDGGPVLGVAGRLRVQNLIKAGSNVAVLDALEASGLVVCNYNHGLFRVGGDLSAQAYIVMDQDQEVSGEIRALFLNEGEVDLRDALVPELFRSEDDVSPEVEWLWARQRAGLPVLR